MFDSSKLENPYQIRGGAGGICKVRRYKLKDFTNLKSAFPVPASTFNADTKQGFSNFFETGKTWFENIQLTHTPFFIFNHQKIPIKYTFSDIKYHLRRM